MPSNITLAQVCIANGYEPPAERPHERIMREVFAKHGINLEIARSRYRKKAHVAARAELYYRFYKELGWPYSKIGNFFHKNHTTIMYFIRKIEAYGSYGAAPDRRARNRRAGAVEAAGQV